MRTVILCGGKGTRAYPYTQEVPKPLLHVDGRPILEHVLGIYAAQGFTDFVLAVGHLGDKVAEFAATLPDSWQVDVVDTGDDTNTGGRVHGCRHLLDEPFMVTYADGVGDVDLHALVDFHHGHDGAATLTTVPLPSQYGTLDIDESGAVRRFLEKPRLPDHRINAGFFCFDPRVFDRWEGEDLEREVLPALVAAGELRAFPHDGFWMSMDTYKDGLELTALCETGKPPWLPRSRDASSPR